MAKSAKKERAVRAAADGRAGSPAREGKAKSATKAKAKSRDKPGAKPGAKTDAKVDTKPAAKPAKRQLEPRLQHAALCFREGMGGEPEILLITSRDTGRWVLPKGWPKKGETGGASALREAGEEAGVVGQAIAEAAGTYRYDKTMSEGPCLHCRVEVHPVAVAYLDFRFPEMRVRKRAWFTPAEAAKAVDEAELKDLLAGFTRLPPPEPEREPEPGREPDPRPGRA